MSSVEAFAAEPGPAGLDALLAMDQAVLEAIPAAVYVCAADGLLVRFNQRAAELWGRTPRPGDNERFCGSFRLYADGRPLSRTETPMEEALRTAAAVQDRELVIERPDGSRVVAAVNIQPIRSAAGRIQGAISCVQDVTARRNAEARVHEAEHRYHDLLEALPAAIYTTDAEGRITFFNRAAAEMAGREPQLGIDQWCVTWRLYREDGTPLPHDECPMAQTLKKKRPVYGEIALAERPDGTRVPFAPYPAPIFDRDGNLVGAINMLVDLTEQRKADERQRATAHRLETLNRISRTLSSDLDIERIVQTVTDSATKLSGAQFGAFFYNVIDDSGDRYFLYTLSGATREAFEKFGLPRNTAVFDPTFRGAGIMRSDDIRADPRYGKNAPHYGMPKGHLPVVSYLAVPVTSRSGEVLGGLFFGHERPGVFTAEAEEIVAGIAAHAAIALDNARLLKAAQTEIEQRRKAEQSLARRMDEQAALYAFTDRLHRAESLPDVYDAALDTIIRALGCERASILLFDETGVMRFIAWRGLSDAYRKAVDGHSPWTRGTQDPQPVCIDDVATADLSEELNAAVQAERIGALSFIPLVVDGKLIGKFMAYYDTPHSFATHEIELALATARQLAFGIERLSAEQQLRDNEERLRLAMQAGKVGVWEWDISCNRLTWTDSLYLIHGVEKESFGGSVEAFSTLIHPDDRASVREGIERALRDDVPYEMEFRVQKPDGQLVWLFSNAIVVKQDGKPVRMLGATLDITERKKADAQRDLLVAELSHRVKNTLATVVSIAKQSFAKGPSFEESRRSFNGRIRALAQTHTRLAEGQWSGVSIETAVLDELAPYRGDDGRNVGVSGPTIVLNAKTAVVLGMALHELATNAAKYGSLSAKNGKVDVCWDLDVFRNELRMCWQESGGPPVTPPQRDGFGRLLLERAVASDLNGKVELNFAPSGLRCEFVLPLEGAAPRNG